MRSLTIWRLVLDESKERAWVVIDEDPNLELELQRVDGAWTESRTTTTFRARRRGAGQDDRHRTQGRYQKAQRGPHEKSVPPKLKRPNSDEPSSSSATTTTRRSPPPPRRPTMPRPLPPPTHVSAIRVLRVARATSPEDPGAARPLRSARAARAGSGRHAAARPRPPRRRAPPRPAGPAAAARAGPGAAAPASRRPATSKAPTHCRSHRRRGAPSRAAAPGPPATPRASPRHGAERPSARSRGRQTRPSSLLLSLKPSPAAEGHHSRRTRRIGSPPPRRALRRPLAGSR